MHIRIVCLLIMLGLVWTARAQSNLHITFIDEDSISFSTNFQRLVQREISALQDSRRTVTYDVLYSGNRVDQVVHNLQTAFDDPETDIVIGIGLISSMMLAQQTAYPKPSIASIIIDRDLQGLSITPDGSSGIHNFTFIESPFDVRRDLDVFHQLYPYRQLGILLDSDIGESAALLQQFFRDRMPGDIPFQFIPLTGEVESTLAGIPADVDALYVLTISRFSSDEVATFFETLNERGLPTFALTGRNYVELGAVAGLAPQSFLPNLARRLALDVMHITEGVNPSELPVEVQTQEEEFVINMHSLKTLELYPHFDLLNQALLLNVDQTSSDIEWSIQSLIYESLRNNLNLKAAQRDVDISVQDIEIAKSNYLPQVDVSSSAVWIDQNRVDVSMGQAAQVSWTANASINQLIFSEPALANIAVQKLVQENQQAILDETELNIILETAQAYLTFLQAKSFVRIQNENVDVTYQNLNISRTKERLGYSGISDVYRLESQLAQNVIDLNDAISGMRQARFNINRLIDHPLEEEFNTIDVDRRDQVSLAGEEWLDDVINNHKDLGRLTRFLVDETFRNAPELRQIELAIRSQERLLKSNQRSFYTPELGLNASWDQPIEYFGASSPPPGFAGLTKDPQLTVAAKMSLPIFQGGFRKAQVQKSKIAIAQLDEQRANLRNGLEASLRSGVEILAASYQRVELSGAAATAAEKNFDIIQDLYRQGEVDITTLIDAQNATLAAELSANNAVYQFISDYLTVERATGQFYFLKTDADKESFQTRVNAYLIEND